MVHYKGLINNLTIECQDLYRSYTLAFAKKIIDAVYFCSAGADAFFISGNTFNVIGKGFYRRKFYRDITFSHNLYINYSFDLFT